MRTIISLIICFALFLYLAKTTVQIKPFRISFGDLSNAIAWLLFFAAILVMSYSVHRKAYVQGLKRGAEIEQEAAIEAARQIIEESKYCKCTPDETTGWMQEVGGVPECNICGKQVKYIKSN